MSGLTVAALADTPKVMTDGNWKLGAELLGLFVAGGRVDEHAGAPAPSCVAVVEAKRMSGERS